MKYLVAFVAALIVAVSSGNLCAQCIDYVVQPGDTVSGISERYLDGLARWGAIERCNPGINIHKLQPGQVLRLPEKRVFSEDSAAKVLKINGYARSNGKDLEEGALLTTDTVIEVDEDSFVTLQLNDGSIVIIEPDSRVRIEDLSDLATGAQRAVIGIESGRIEIEAAPQKPGARFEISTPTATTSVRGTRFRTGNEKNGSSITEVLSGQVDVHHADNERTRQRLTEGQGIVVSAGDAVLTAPEPLLAAPDLSGVAEKYTRTVIDLNFPKVPNATAYRVSVARDPAFTDVIARVEHGEPNIQIVNLEDGQYYLRARGISSNGIHGVDQQKGFVLHARPEPPFTLAPAPASRLSSAKPVQLAWTKPQDAAFYSLEIEKDGQPFSLVEENSATDFAFNAAPGDYRWRLATHNTDKRAGPFGDWVAFSVIDPPKGPDAAVDLSDESKLVLSWPGDAGNTFHWQLAKGDNFENALIDEGSTTTPTVALDKPEGGTYFVRVRTTTSDGIEGAYGSTQQIDIPKEEPSPLWLLLLTVPFILL